MLDTYIPYTVWSYPYRGTTVVNVEQTTFVGGLSDAHVRRILRLANLAPDIVEAIVEGHQPRTLAVEVSACGRSRNSCCDPRRRTALNSLLRRI